MTAKGWKRVAFALGLGCLLIAWCGRGGGGGGEDGDSGKTDQATRAGASESGSDFTAGARDKPSLESGGQSASAEGRRGEEAARTWPGEEEPPAPKAHWLWRFFRPRPDESMMDYRDRVLPVVQAAVEPQRRRVALRRDDFIARADLDDDQIAEMNAAVDGAAEAITARVFDGIFSGELMPANVRPMTGVKFARDILDEVVRADEAVREVLDDRQRRMLDEGGFDVADYLLFSTRWEELFGIAP